MDLFSSGVVVSLLSKRKVFRPMRPLPPKKRVCPGMRSTFGQFPPYTFCASGSPSPKLFSRLKPICSFRLSPPSIGKGFFPSEAPCVLFLFWSDSRALTRGRHFQVIPRDSSTKLSFLDNRSATPFLSGPFPFFEGRFLAALAGLVDWLICRPFPLKSRSDRPTV